MLENSRQTTLHFKHIKNIAGEVFKSLNKSNPALYKRYISETKYFLLLIGGSVLTYFQKITYGKHALVIMESTLAICFQIIWRH